MTVIKDNPRSLIEVPRRSALSLGLAAVAGMAGGSFSHAAGADGGIKITVLYGAPKDPAQLLRRSNARKWLWDFQVPAMHRRPSIASSRRGLIVPST